MARQGKPAPAPKFDREALRDLARCYARAAVDSMIQESAPAPASAGARQSRKRSNHRKENGK